MKKGESKLPIIHGEMIEVKKPRKVRPLTLPLRINKIHGSNEFHQF